MCVVGKPAATAWYTPPVALGRRKTGHLSDLEASSTSQRVVTQTRPARDVCLPLTRAERRGIHHSHAEKRLPYRRERCSRLMPTTAATDEILIVSPRSRRLPITALSFASVTDTRARCVVNAPCRILSDGVPAITRLRRAATWCDLCELRLVTKAEFHGKLLFIVF